MRQVIRLLSGESWKSIRAEMQHQVEQQKALVGLALGLGLLFAIPKLVKFMGSG